MRKIHLLFFVSLFVAGVATAQTLPDNRAAGSGALIPVSITFQTDPPGLSVIIDGTTHTTPYSTDWDTGTEHTISTTSPQFNGTDTRHVFLRWSDAGALTHTVEAPRRSRTYTAEFSTQYFLSMSANPSSGGTVTPSSGWYNGGQDVAINATAGAGYAFIRWTGSGSGSYTGTTRSTTITMNGPISQVAGFSEVTQPALSVTPSDRAVSSSAGSTTFAVSNTGSGTMNWTAGSDQSWATITGGGSGTNGGIITVSYTANPSSTDSRTATITVTATGATGSPHSVTVTQASATGPVLVKDTTSVSDDFGGTVLDAGLWTVIDPKGDASVLVGNNQLSVVVSGGIAHEPWTAGNNAPRIMQNVSSSMNVNAWTAKFNSVPGGSPTSIPMEGLLFEQDSENFVRVDIFGNGTSIYAFAARFVNGVANPEVLFNSPIPVTGPPVWLHVTRAGTLWRAYCSVDGVSAFLLGTFEHEISINRVGVFAGNAGTMPQPFTAYLDYFQGALPAKAFLSLPDSGVSGVTVPVTFTWHASAGATTYHLQVATDPGFVSGVVDSLVTETSGIVYVLQPAPGNFWWRVTGKNDAGWGQPSDARPFSTFPVDVNPGANRPEKYALEQNFPNPFNPKTVVSSQLPVACDVKLVVYDLLGRQVAVLADERRVAGAYHDSFDGRGLASGVYICRLTAGEFAQSRIMMLLK